MTSTPTAARTTPEAARADTGIRWETKVPLLTHPLVVRQLVLVAVGPGLFLALVMTLILVARGASERVPLVLLIALLATLGWGALMAFVVMILFRGRVRVRFIVDDHGATWETVDPVAKRGSRLAVLVGILGGSPQAAGAGALAASSEIQRIRWREVSEARFDRRRHAITLRGRRRPVMLLVCRREIYDEVANLVRGRVAETTKAGARGARL